MAYGPDGSVLIETPAEKEARERAAEQGTDRRHRKLQLWFNGALMIATVLTAVIVLYQNRILRQSLVEMQKQSSAATVSAEAAQDALDLARQQFLADQQPYVWRLHVIPEQSSGGVSVTRDGLAADGRVYWRVSYRNFGKSPAIQFGSRARLFVGPDALKQADTWLANLRPLARSDRNGVSPPNADGVFTTVISTNTYSSPELAVLTKHDFGIVVIGRFEYEDLSGTFYTHDFCSGRLATSVIADCPTRNVIREGIPKGRDK